MSTAITPAELAARDIARADRAAILADTAVRLWDKLDAVAQAGHLTARHVHLPAVRDSDGVVVLEWVAGPWAMTATPGLPTLPAHAPGAVVELFAAHRDWAARGDSCAIAARDPDGAVPEEFYPTLGHFATDGNITPGMIAGFRRDVETVARGEGKSPTIDPGGPPAGSPVGSLGDTPLRNPAEILTPDDWIAVSAPATQAAQSVRIAPAAEAPPMPLAPPDVYAARAAGLDAILPVVRRATKASRGQFKASGLLAPLIGLLMKFLISNLPMLIDIIVDAWKAHEQPATGGGGPRWPEAAAEPLNPAVRRALQDIRAGKPEPE
jgi:hypothetical protein